MPVPTDSSTKAQFNKYKSRAEGGELAAFIIENDGKVEIIEPSKAKVLTPQKLKAQLKGKGVAGYFFKSSNGPVFNVVAGKKGGHAGQPWVKYLLRAQLQISSFEVQTDPGADIDEARVSSSAPPVSSVGDGPGDLLGDMDLLDIESDAPTVRSELDLLDGLPDQDGEGGDDNMDGLDLLEDVPETVLIERDGVRHIQQEWDRREQLDGPVPDDMPHPDEDLVSVLRTNQMFEVQDGVHAPMTWEDVSQGDLGKAQERLAFERKATRWMRGNLTRSVNGRSGRAKQSIEKNCDMALGLSNILSAHPELLEDGGLLGRIVGRHGGPLDDQWQHSTSDSAGDIATKIQQSARRLHDGGGEGEDGNLVLQFIGCFTDGLTEVIEGEEKAIEQLDAIWPEFCEAFGVDEEDRASFKTALLTRVQNYKSIAGGRSDTLAGKGARKKKTRAGINPEDPRLRISEHEALIKGDVSGSVHSCFLAYELAESLGNPKGLAVEKDVLLTDRGLIDGRVADALSLTAGGRKLPGEMAKEQQQDMVFHTAYEMLNGLRGITGVPMLTQDQATTVFEYLWKGKGYAQAIEAVFPSQRFGWMPSGD